MSILTEREIMDLFNNTPDSSYQHQTSFPLDPELVKAHDALNDKIRKGNMKIKFMTVIKDALFNREISLNEMRHWIKVLDNEGREEKVPQKRKVIPETS